MIDLVTVSLVVIVPLVIYSWRAARAGSYLNHKRAQVTLLVVLSIAVTFFEIDMQQSGGVFELARGGRFADTLFLYASVYIHLFFSVTTSFLWVFLAVWSLIKFASPPQPNSFSATHMLFGRVAMIDMVLTAVTGIEVYLVGMVL